jgi:tetratricopeptide (TPR) repeat protein
VLLFTTPGIAQTASPPTNPRPALPPAPSDTPAASAAKQDPARQHAMELFDAGKLVEAMPLLEQLSADHEQDATIKERWAAAMMGYAMTLSDTELRVKARVRARTIALQAQKLGDNSPMIQVVIQIPPDGSEPVFSNQKDLDSAMKAAEADFARGDFDKARDGYLHALLLSPNNYEAALFIGDTYFRQHVNGSACEWFARASQIDPNRESAYRYWGDALWAAGKSSEARDKYIDAIIAEPYEKNSWSGLSQWAQRTKVILNWIRMQDKGKLISTAAGTKIGLDPSFHTENPMFKPWMVYYGRRLEWQKEKFKQQFPNELNYRRTAREESDSLHLMVAALKQPSVSSIEPSLAAMVKAYEAGFIEPFALLNRADKEIAQDYAPYRAAHRDVLYRYFDEFVVPKAPVDSSQ